ncbi:MAG TPA: FAA hydrolase family protein, partial [Actinomycetota bacterium]|nr:FAA hydrolase family protein [Actinomycetota bacterium]
MRLVTFERDGGRRLGALVGDTVVDLSSAVGLPAFPSTMEELIEAGLPTLDSARQALHRDGVIERFAVPGARLLVPVL